MNPSPLKLDLSAAQCVSLELQFDIDIPQAVRQELLALGSHEGDDEENVIFHEDYRFESQKLHSLGEVRFAEDGPGDVLIEYLVESELEDQTELHQTDFTLGHLFSAIEVLTEPVEAFFTLRFDLGSSANSRFLRLMPYNAGINGGMAVEYRGAHVQVNTPEGDAFDLWYDLRHDETLEATLRFTLKRRPTVELPREGLDRGRKFIARMLSGH